MKKIVRVLALWVLTLPVSGFAADAWMPQGYSVSIIDTVVEENFAYLTLEGYSNTNCSHNRIALRHSNPRKFDQMFSMVLSALHSGAKVKFYFPDTSVIPPKNGSVLK